MRETQVSPMKVRLRPLAPEATKTLKVEWREQPPRKPGERLLKNLAVAAALVLCAVTLRTGAIPTLNEATDAILTAATDQSLLDDQLGKLSFVSKLFPEAVLVAGALSGVPQAHRARTITTARTIARIFFICFCPPIFIFCFELKL